MRSDIALIGDKAEELHSIQRSLPNSFALNSFGSPELLLSSFSSNSYSALLINVHHGHHAFEWFDKIMEHPSYNGCPILFLSSDETEELRIKSFELGAVDFINLNVHPDELQARLNSKIKFFKHHRAILEFEGLKINLTFLKATLQDNDLGLTYLELRILVNVLKSHPHPIGKETFIQQIWRKPVVLDATLHTHLFNLNSKLKDWGHELVKVKNHGLQLVPKTEAKS